MDIIIHKDLFEKLDNNLDRPLSQVSAPDSLGKSTWVSSWLASGRYIQDYINGVDYGTVTGPTTRLAARFEGYLLLEAVVSDTGKATNLK